jgi:hypothetical protein
LNESDSAPILKDWRKQGIAGHEEDARELSAHLFCAFQGMAAVAHGANEPDLVLMEVRRLKNWINTL